jgi:hypothetical protein
MKKFFLIVLAFFVAVPAALAQERRTYSQAELDQMLAPIALYPDALLSQVLMASTYPLDIVEAARWTRAHPGLQGDEAVSRVADEAWDPSVKSLAALPNLLQRMDEKLAWTRSLGEAFLEQEPHVMETVQQLRRRAQAAGNLVPDERLRVLADGGTIIIEPADPQIVYVPYYDPWVVYGTWGWPAYPPVVWMPWHGYHAYRTGFWWGVGVGVTSRFFFGGVDWHQRHVRVVHVDNHYVRPRAAHGYVQAHRPMHVGKWQHAPVQRREFERRRSDAARFQPRAQPMPPALSASPPVRRMEAQPRLVELPRLVEQPRRAEQPRRIDQPRLVEEPRRAEQPRLVDKPRRVDQPRRAEQPRQESRPQFRAQPRGRDGGGQRHAERNGRRG